MHTYYYIHTLSKIEKKSRKISENKKKIHIITHENLKKKNEQKLTLNCVHNL